jgi:hypothetical protein
MKLAYRVSRLEAPLPDGRFLHWARVVAAEVAAELGLDPEEVVREAEAILAGAKGAGVLGSRDDFAAYLGAESGVAPEVILAEAERLMGRR